MQLLSKAAVRAVPRRQCDHRQLVAGLYTTPIGAAQAGPSKTGESRHLERPLLDLPIGILHVDGEVGMRVDELDAGDGSADRDRLVDVELCLDRMVGRDSCR